MGHNDHYNNHNDHYNDNKYHHNNYKYHNYNHDNYNNQHNHDNKHHYNYFYDHFYYFFYIFNLANYNSFYPDPTSKLSVDSWRFNPFTSLGSDVFLCKLIHCFNKLTKDK